MLAWITANWGSLLVGALLALVLALIIRKLIRDKRDTGGCGCGCSGCASKGLCHPDASGSA